jgi:hypothetical protein
MVTSVQHWQDQPVIAAFSSKTASPLPLGQRLRLPILK